jgi:hypothetical protein
LLVERTGQGFEAWVADIWLFGRDDGAFAGYGFFGGEFCGSVFGGAGEVTGVFLASLALEGFGVAVLVEVGVRRVRCEVFSVAIVAVVMGGAFSLAEGFLCCC